MPTETAFGIRLKLKNCFIKVPIAVVLRDVFIVDLWRYDHQHSEKTSGIKDGEPFARNCEGVRLPSARDDLAPEMKRRSGIRQTEAARSSNSGNLRSLQRFLYASPKG